MRDAAFPLRRTDTVDPVGWLAAERPVLLEFLATLTPSEWGVPTECPAWSVFDIALHLLGDDLSLLSRQRDGASSGVMALVDEDPSGGIPDLINRFNERWVAAARFMSPGLVTELLQLTGGWTLSFLPALRSVAPDDGAAVTFAIPGPTSNARSARTAGLPSRHRPAGSAENGQMRTGPGTMGIVLTVGECENGSPGAGCRVPPPDWISTTATIVSAASRAITITVRRPDG